MDNSKYIKALDTAFKSARTRYTTAYNALKSAQKAASDAEKAYAISRTTENQLAHTRAQLELKQAQEKWNTERHVFGEFETTMNKLDRQHKEEAEREGRLNPASVDNDGIALLNSPYLQASDLFGLVETYKGNQTMLALVSRKASEMLNTAKDTTERHMLIRAAESAKNTKPDSWEMAKGVAEVCSGIHYAKAHMHYPSPEIVESYCNAYESQMGKICE